MNPSACRRVDLLQTPAPVGRMVAEFVAGSTEARHGQIGGDGEGAGHVGVAEKEVKM